MSLEYCNYCGSVIDSDMDATHKVDCEARLDVINIQAEESEEYEEFKLKADSYVRERLEIYTEAQVEQELRHIWDDRFYKANPIQ